MTDERSEWTISDLGGLHAELSVLRAQRDELLAALQDWIAHRNIVFDAQMRGTLDSIPTNRIDEIVAKAEAAIARATGG